MAPTLGQHTAEVLRHVLGYDDSRVAELEPER
jgi:crotonobetainyl-CoA:carnitine CoA-transferase CaiB-like acyl-CoA transferase